MPRPQSVPPDCPAGLEFLTAVDQVIIHQAVEVIEGSYSHCQWSFYFSSQFSCVETKACIFIMTNLLSVLYHSILITVKFGSSYHKLD